MLFGPGAGVAAIAGPRSQGEVLLALRLQGGSSRQPSTRRSLLAMGAAGLLATGAATVISDASGAAPADAATTTSGGTPDWANVTAYGADPTGAAASTAAFKAAISAAASAGGGVVYIPAGTY